MVNTAGSRVQQTVLKEVGCRGILSEEGYGTQGLSMQGAGYSN